MVGSGLVPPLSPCPRIVVTSDLLQAPRLVTRLLLDVLITCPLAQSLDRKPTAHSLIFDAHVDLLEPTNCGQQLSHNSRAVRDASQNPFPFAASNSWVPKPIYRGLISDVPLLRIQTSPPRAHMDEIYAHFNSCPTKIAAWSRLLMLRQSPHDFPTPDVFYNRAIPTLTKLKDELVHLGWLETPRHQRPPGILFIIESPAQRHSPSSSSPDGNESFFNSRTLEEDRRAADESKERVIFALPSELSAFLEYRPDIQKIFHDPRLFRPVLNQYGHPVLTASDELDSLGAPALRQIFYLLQLVVPGMFLLVHDSLSFSRKSFALSFPPSNNRSLNSRRDASQGGGDSIASRGSNKLSFRRTRRALPPAEWIESRVGTLEGIFGKHLLHDLLNCARDVELTVWITFHGPDGDELDAGSDAGGFDSPQPLDISWPPDTPADAFNGGIDVPNKLSAVTPGVGTRNRFVDHTRLARSL